MQQRIITFWGERTYSTVDQNATSVAGGYKVLNEVAERLMWLSTLQSVSYSHMFFPQADGLLVQFFMTVLYMGDDLLELYGESDDRFVGRIIKDIKLVKVRLWELQQLNDV